MAAVPAIILRKCLLFMLSSLPSIVYWIRKYDSSPMLFDIQISLVHNISKSSRSISMHLEYNKIVNDIRNLPLEEKEEIKALLEKYIIEERRAEIYADYKRSRRESRNRRLTFSSRIAELKKTI